MFADRSRQTGRYAPRTRIPTALSLALIALLTLGGLFAFVPTSAVGAAQPQAPAAFAFTVNDTSDRPDFDPNDSVCNALVALPSPVPSPLPSPAPTGTCTLRAAIQQANALALVDPAHTFTISLAAGATYLLNVADTIGPNEDDAATGDLDVAANVTLVGNGATISGGSDVLDCLCSPPSPSPDDRVFQVLAGYTVVMDGVTISHGFVDANPGGGILNDGGKGTGGSLTISNSTLSRNASASGGAIFNGLDRTLTMTNVVLSGNAAVNGGGLLNVGTATVTGGTIQSNGLLGLGFGGGISNIGTLTVNGSAIVGNSHAFGGGLANGVPCLCVAAPPPGIPTATLTNTTVNNNSSLLLGGGIANFDGVLQMTGGTLNGNATTGVLALTGIGGGGGGLFNFGAATLTEVTVDNNNVASFGIGALSSGVGGGIANAGELVFDRGTISNNTIAGPGEGGGLLNGMAALAATRAQVAGQPLAPRIAAIDTVATVTNSTISGNVAPNGAGGVLNDDDSAILLTHVTVANNQGNLVNRVGATNAAGAIVVQNAVVAASTGGPNCVGLITDNGYNVEDGASCVFVATGSVANADPLLGPLQLTAPGATATHALLAGSPARDRVPASGAGCLATDQRGVARPISSACDSGAFEGSPGFLVTVTTTGNGSVSPGTGTYAGPTQNFTATAAAGNLFLGWYVDGQFVGFNNPLVLPLTRDRAVRAEFAPNPTFCDVGPGKAIDANDPAYTAIVNLTARGVIKGKVNAGGQGGPTCFDPEGTANRAEAAAFIARTFDWDDETYPNPFQDRCNDEGCIDVELWNDIAVLRHYGVVQGYNATTFGPFDRVTRVQMISLISRAFNTYDGPQPDWNTITVDDSSVYPEVLPSSSHRLDVVTYAKNAGIIPDTSSTASWPNSATTGQNAPASREFVARALWQAYAIYFGTNRVQP